MRREYRGPYNQISFGPNLQWHCSVWRQGYIQEGAVQVECHFSPEPALVSIGSVKVSLGPRAVLSNGDLTQIELQLLQLGLGQQVRPRGGQGLRPPAAPHIALAGCLKISRYLASVF